ncbi:migration and invasion enhancer 1-like [Glandiceps talaboti]
MFLVQWLAMREEDKVKNGAFEVSIDGKVLFSKLKQGGFPHNKQIVTAIREYKGGYVEEITDSQSPCVIL